MLQTDLAQPSILTLDAAGQDSLVVPGGGWMLEADFSVQGNDLLLTGQDGAQVLIRDFFASDTPPDLMTDGGAVIPAELAVSLAGPLAPGQFALVQNGPFQVAQGAEEAVGKVEATDGLVEAVRVDGTTVALTRGSPIYQGDTIVTAKGAAIGITFIDDTTFSLGEEGRMVLDELVYDPGGDSTFNANLVQGVFSFVSGQIAKTSPEGMTVSTPVATIGIRGTWVAGRAAQEGEQNTISLLPEIDAQGDTIIGELIVRTSGGTVTLNQIGATIQMTSSLLPPPPPLVFSPQQIQQQFGAALNSLPALPSADRGEGDAKPDTVAPRPDGDAPAATGDTPADQGAPPRGEIPPGDAAGRVADVNLPGSTLNDRVGGLDPLFGGRDPLFGGGDSLLGRGNDVFADPVIRTPGTFVFDFSKPFDAGPTVIDPRAPDPAQTKTISTFAQVLHGTTGNDVIVGNDQSTRVIMAQGSSLGGVDTVDGGAGTDEIAFQNLDGVALIFDATVSQDVNNPSPSPDDARFSDASGGFSGSVNLTSIEQVFANDGVETFSDTPGTTVTVGADGVRLKVDPLDAGKGYIVAGMDAGNDTITLANNTNLAGSYNGLTSVAGATVTSGSVLGSIIFGKGGDDTITGSEVDDIIFGGAGNDTLDGGGTTTTGGSELIFGGSGNDIINVTAATDGSAFVGGAGVDSLSYAGLSGGAITFAFSGTAAAAVRTFNATTVSDSIKGIETLIGTAGSGNANTFNFVGDSTVLGLTTITGGDQNDLFAYGAGAATGATLDGGAGADTLSFATGGSYTVNLANVETVTGSTGADSLSFGTAVTAATAIDLGAGTDSLALSAGTNTLAVTSVEAINGTASADNLTFSTVQSGLFVDLTGGADALTLANGTNDLTITDVEAISGGTGADTLTIAGTSASTVAAGSGADVLTLSGTGVHTTQYNALADGGDQVNGFAAGPSGDVFKFTTAFGGAQTINLALESSGAGTTGANVIVADSSLLGTGTAQADVQALLGTLHANNAFTTTTNKFVVGVMDNDASGTLNAGDHYALFYDADVTTGNAVLIATSDIDASVTAATTWDATNFSAMA